MSTIPVGTVLRPTHDLLDFRGSHRVLWSSEDTNEIVLIPIPPPLKRSSVRYYPSPFKRRLSIIQGLLHNTDVVVSIATPPALVHLSDEAIRARYPMRTGKTKRKQRKDSAPIQTRDEDYALIMPLLEEIGVAPAAVYGSNRIADWIKQRSSETGIGQSRIRCALNKYQAMACGKNGLLPFLDKCGGPNLERSQEHGMLGRKTFAARLGMILEPGIPLTITDKDHLGWGWKTFLHEGQSVDEAYLLTMAVFYSDGETLHQGRTFPVLKPLSQRPTLAQFRYWGPRGAGAKAAWELLLRPGEWEKRYRAMYGTARGGIKAVGQIASGDSTSNDVNMISVASRLKAIGTGTVLRYHDVFSDCVVGVAFGLEPPSERLALQGIYNAASDKVEFCRRFGIEITPDQFPSAFYRLYHYDNGELRTEGSINLLKHLGSNAEFVQAGRADLKPLPESGHRSFHKKLDHKIAGTTHGRQRIRGEEESSISACWTYWEYMRELLLAIIHHNTVAPADHLLTVEMRRDGVAPNRAAIHQWAVRKGYIAGLPLDINQLRARLLPTIKAVVRPNGIFLLRPDRAEKRALVRGARFMGARAVQLQWLEKARRRGTFDIEVHHDSNDLTRIWFVDSGGVHELINVACDSVLRREGTLADLLSIQDDDALQQLLDQEAIDQSDANFIVGRYEQDHANRKAKRDEIKASGRKLTKTELKSNIAENRAKELKDIASQLDPVTRAPYTDASADTDQQATPGTETVADTGVAQPVGDDLDAALAHFRAQEA